MKYEELMEQLDNEIVKYYCSTKKYDLYVSFMGDVIKVHKNTHKVSKLNIPISNQGYKRINVNGKCLSVHRMVAKLYIPNEYPEYHNIVHHKNSIRTDNRASNLQWVSSTLHQDIHREEKEHRYKYDGKFSYENELWDKFNETEPTEKNIWDTDAFDEETAYNIYYKEYESRKSDPSYLN